MSALRWDEYVEEATARIASRRTARDVRRELRDHLETAAQALVAEGLSRDDAEDEAMRRFGPVDVLRDHDAVHYRPWAPAWPAFVGAVAAVLAVAVMAGGADPAGAIILAWAIAWSFVHPHAFPAAWRQAWTAPKRAELVDRARHLQPFAIAGDLAGVLLAPEGWRFGGEPLFFLAWLAVATAAWLAAAWRLRARGDDGAIFPLGAGVASTSLLLTGGVFALVAGQAWELPLIVLVACLYLSGANVLDWLARERRRARERDVLPLTVEGGPSRPV